MQIKKCLSTALLLSIIAINAVLAMKLDPLLMPALTSASYDKAGVELLSSIDRVFLNACKNEKSIEFAISKGANIRAVDPQNGYNAMHYACMNGNIDRVMFLIEKGLEFDRHAKLLLKSELLSNKLIEISMNCFLSSELFCEKAQKLLDFGADINAVDKAFATPLSYVCASCNKESFAKAEFLLKKGANINHKSKIGGVEGTVIYHLVALPMLIGNVRVHEDNSRVLEMVQFLIKNGIDVNILGKGNHSVLQAAILSENTQCIKELLKDPNLNINSVDENGHNAIWELVTRYEKKDALDLLKLLLDQQCSPIVIDRMDRCSIMHVAAQRGDLDIINELLKNNRIGANDNNVYGNTPLHIAIANGKLAVTKRLLDAGAQVNVSNNKGLTPLHYAAEVASVKVVEKLLEAGADVNAVDKEGQTPLHKACLKSDAAVVQKLLRAGARQQRDNSKKTPLQLSQNNKAHKEIAEVLKNGQQKEVKLKPAQKKSRVKQKLLQKSTKKTDLAPSKSLNLNDKDNAASETVVNNKIEFVKESEISVVSQVKTPTIIERAQEVVIKALTGQSTDAVVKKTYANAIGVQMNQHMADSAEKNKSITVGDHVTIKEPLHPVRLIPEDPFKNVQYSQHVLGKMSNPRDFLHNFNLRVEGLWKYMKLKKVKNKKNGLTVEKYSLGTEMTLPSGRCIDGTFKIIKNEQGIIVHRFYHPKKDKTNKDVPLLLPSSTVTI